MNTFLTRRILSIKLSFLIAVGTIALVLTSSSCFRDEETNSVETIEPEPTTEIVANSTTVVAMPTVAESATPENATATTPAATSTIESPTSVPVVTPTSIPAATPTPTPVVIPTAVPTPTAVPVVTPTVVPTPVSTTVPPSETQVPTLVSTPSETPTPTTFVVSAPSPTPTSIPMPSPTPFVAPTPVGTVDPRYGVASTSPANSTHVETLGVKTFLNFGAGTENIPNGTSKVLYLHSVSPVPHQLITSSAAAAPGSTWYVVGEPNVSGIDPFATIADFHDTYAAIKAADPTAKITSPSILNFDFTCIQCGGYESGHSWVDRFISAYQSVYGVNPPVDYWAIDAYPIIWASDQFPTTRSDIVIDQIAGYRQYLDAIESEASKPIIVTEVGLHWGFDQITFGAEACNGPYPAGNYQTAQVIEYLKSIFSWLESVSVTENILNWYLFSTYRDLTACHPDSGYGLTLFEGPDNNSPRSSVGNFFYDWIRGLRD